MPTDAMHALRLFLYPEIFAVGRVARRLRTADETTVYLGLAGLLVGCVATGFKVKVRNSKIVLFFSSFVYDWMTRIAFVPNGIISAMCYLQPRRSIWNEPEDVARKLVTSGESLETVKRDLIAKKERSYVEEDLVQLYDTLPVVDAQRDLIGRSWRGKIVRVNSSVLDLADWFIVKPLSLLGIGWGKRYITAHLGDPLLFRFLNTLYFPIPLWGNVGMTNIEWRGKPTATMNYDHQPWKDYFRLLSSEPGKVVLLGVWTHKHIAGGWFTLTLDPDVPTV